jgi:hypothetical protein
MRRCSNMKSSLIPLTLFQGRCKKPPLSLPLYLCLLSAVSILLLYFVIPLPTTPTVRSITDVPWSTTATNNNIIINNKTSTSDTPSKKQPRIPHRIMFTYPHRLLETKEPRHFYDNVMHTIHEYGRLWNLTPSTVWTKTTTLTETTTMINATYNDTQSTTQIALTEASVAPWVDWYTNAECEIVIQRMRPSMLRFFREEPYGAYKGDICRVAALYYYGGYYFDVDLKVVEPLNLDDDNDTISFATVQSTDGSLFQAFIAVEPYSPFMLKTMDFMEEHYTHPPPPPPPGQFSIHMGPLTMRQAYDWLMQQNSNNTTTDNATATTNDTITTDDTTSNNSNNTVTETTTSSLVSNPHRTVSDKEVYFLYEFNLEDDRSRYPQLSLQPGIGFCNFVCHNPFTRVVYFFSRVVGSTHCQPLQ